MHAEIPLARNKVGVFITILQSNTLLYEYFATIKKKRTLIQTPLACNAALFSRPLRSNVITRRKIIIFSSYLRPTDGHLSSTNELINPDRILMIRSSSRLETRLFSLVNNKNVRFQQRVNRR
jgi:hypothetical protein